MGASARFMFQRMGARNSCLLTRAEELQLPTGFKQAPPTNFVFTIQITQSCWQVLLLQEQVVSDIAWLRR